MIRFIEHGMRCRPSMDSVSGELLIYRVRDNPQITKEQLFAWFGQLLEQVIQYHRSHDNQNYRYLNPYSVLVARDGKLLLLDLEAESNEFVMRNLQKRAMRAHFVKPIVHITEGSGEQLDLYGYGKTIQFILANTNVEPSLSKFQENKLEKIINKCLNESSGKQYKGLNQIEKELPIMRDKAKWKDKKELIFAAAAVVSMAMAVCSLIFVYYLTQEQSYIKNWVWEMEQQWEISDEIPDMDAVKEMINRVETDLLEEVGVVKESVNSVNEQLEQHLCEVEQKEAEEENAENAQPAEDQKQEGGETAEATQEVQSETGQTDMQDVTVQTE